MVFVYENKSFAKKTGNRQEVWDNVCFQTASGIQKTGLKLNARGRIVSAKKSKLAQERYKANGGGFAKKLESIKEVKGNEFMQKLLGKGSNSSLKKPVEETVPTGPKKKRRRRSKKSSLST